MTAYCPDCLVVEVSPAARDGRCSLFRPSRRHSVPRANSLRRDGYSSNFDQFVSHHYKENDR